MHLSEGTLVTFYCFISGIESMFLYFHPVELELGKIIYIYIYIYMHLSEGTLVTFPVRSMSYCPQCVIRSISQSASKVVVSFMAFGFFREPWR